VIYARFLLAHLPEPGVLAHAWAGELAPGGLLILEEVEWIRTGAYAQAAMGGKVLDFLIAVIDGPTRPPAA